MTDRPIPPTSSLPDGAPVVRVPAGMVTIAMAAQAVEDGDDYWLTTMPPIVHYYRLTVRDYWQLLVDEHAHLLQWLEQSGLIGRPDDGE